MSALTAFDADVLIYAAVPGHPLGSRVATLIDRDGGLGSAMLLPEVLTKPLRTDPGSEEVAELARLLARLQLLPFDDPTARLSVSLGAQYGLRAADAAHLATAVAAGADRFLTNNHKDFSAAITEIEVIHPDQLG